MRHRPPLAIHVCANLSAAASGRPWPALASFADSIQCATAICDRAGIVEQTTLADGGLLEPGTNMLALAQDVHFFKTLSPAHLKVIHGGVDASAAASKDGPFPNPPKAGETPPAPPERGDEPAGEAPAFTIE
jgi:hypothetical protein